MRSRVTIGIAAAVAVVSLGVSAWAWGQIPDNRLIPIHWGIDGQPNGYAPKAIGLLLLPAIIVGVGIIFGVIPYLDPRREHQERMTPARLWIMGAAMVVLGGVHVAAVLAAVGAAVDIGRIVGGSVGALFVVIGNYLGKTRSNWFVGIRTPWTLSSELAWSRTHRLGGYLFMGAGALSILLALVAPLPVLAVGMLTAIALAAVVSVAYSYFAWRADPDRTHSEAEP